MKRTIAAIATAAVAAAVVTCSPAASAKPVDPGNDGSFTPAGLVASGGRTDQQFWGESIWLADAFGGHAGLRLADAAHSSVGRLARVSIALALLQRSTQADDRRGSSRPLLAY